MSNLNTLKEANILEKKYKVTRFEDSFSSKNVILPPKDIAVLGKLLGLTFLKFLVDTSSFAAPLFLFLRFVLLLLLDTVVTRPILLSICEGKMAQLVGLSYIWAINIRKKKE